MVAVGRGRGIVASAASSTAGWRNLAPRRAARWVLYVTASAFVTALILAGNQAPNHGGGNQDSALNFGALAARTGAWNPGADSAEQPAPPAAPEQNGPQMNPAPLLLEQAIPAEVPAESERSAGLHRQQQELEGEDSAVSSAQTPGATADGEGLQDMSAGPSVVPEDESVENTLPIKDIHHESLYKYHVHTEKEQREDTLVYNKAKSNLVLNKYLILAVASSGNLDFTQNWILSLRLTGYTRYIVMCLDALICAQLDPAHSILVPRHWLQSEIDINPLAYGTPAYVNLVQSKTLTVIPFFRMGFTVLFSDVDIVWKSHGIVPYIDFMMKDNSFREAVFSIEQTPDAEPSVNTGFWLAKPTPTIIQLFDQTVDLQTRLNVTQQYAFNAALKIAKLRSSSKIAYLDKALFPNGWVYFKDRLHEATGITPLIVHANYMRGSAVKRQSLREAGLWMLEKEADKYRP